MRLSTAEKVNAGFGIALAIIGLIGLASLTSMRQYSRTAQELALTHQALTDLNAVLGALTDAESSSRGYVLTGEDAYLEPFAEAVTQSGQSILRLRQVVAEELQRQQLDRLAELSEHRVAIMSEIIALRRDEGMGPAVALVRTGRGLHVMDSIRVVAEEFERAELLRLAQREQRVRRSARISTAVVAVGGVLAFLIVLASAVAIRRDYTERRRAELALRESEALLSQFMEHLPIGVVVVDAGSRVRFANQAAIALAGPGLLLDTGTQPLSLHRAGGEPLPDAEAPLVAALAGRRDAHTEAELRVDGRTLPLEVAAAPIYDAHGRIAYAIAAFTDVTERRRAEEALRAARDAAEAASRTKSEFLARMSHELRTPLNSVIGFAGVLLKNRAGNLSEQDVTFVSRILANGRHLLHLINDILDLSRIEAGKVVMEREPVDVGRLVEQLVAELEQNRAPGVELQARVPPEINAVMTDAARLRQVLTNILGNALKFTLQGRVEVRVETVPGSRDVARVVVEDTGIGIPAARQAAVFDAFEQADSSTARRFGGTGLGLPISRALCELLGYELRLQSEEGAGTTFTVEMAGLRDRPAGDVGVVERAGVRRGGLVLIIDDDALSRRLLMHQVEEFGFRAVTAASGEEGVRLARELRPDLITLDLILPGSSGWDVLCQLKTESALAAIPVIVVSVLAEESRATLLGAIDVLQKPVRREELQDALQRNLGSRRGRVLVVEDSPDARQLMEQMLRGETRELRLAEHGRAALEVLRDFTPDLVITDLLMPVMDGITFLEIFRGTPRFRHVPVIVVTAKDLTPLELELLERHTAAVLRKGSALEDDLPRVMHALLRQPRDPADTT